METCSTRSSRKSAWQVCARLFGLVLLLVAGPWLVGELNKPSKAEAKQLRADIETVLSLRAAGRVRESGHAGVELARKWERYMDPSGQSLMTHEQIDAAYDRLEAQDGTRSHRARQRQSAAESLRILPVDYHWPRNVALPISLVVVGLAVLVASYRK